MAQRKQLDQSVRTLTAQAVSASLADAVIDKSAIEAAWFCNTRQGALEGQHGMRGQASLSAYGLESIPIFNTDNACASSSSGMLQAYAAVQEGLYDVVLVVGAEKMNYAEKRLGEAGIVNWPTSISRSCLRLAKALNRRRVMWMRLNDLCS